MFIFEHPLSGIDITFRLYVALNSPDSPQALLKKNQAKKRLKKEV